MQVRDIMRRPVWLASSMSIAEASRIISETDISAALVGNSADASGILTEKDLIRKILAKGKNPAEYTVKDFMSSPLVTISPNMHLVDATEKMEQHGIRHLVVEERAKVLGMITADQLSKHYRFMVASGILRSGSAIPQHAYYRPSYFAREY